MKIMESVIVGSLVAVGFAVLLTGCIHVTDIAGKSDHPAIKDNPYCVTGNEFVAQSFLMVNVFRSRRGGYGLSGANQEMAEMGPSERMGALGYLRPGDTVIVERVYWVTHFDVGDHVEIRAKVLSGPEKGRRVDIGRVQEPKYLRQVK